MKSPIGNQTVELVSTKNSISDVVMNTINNTDQEEPFMVCSLGDVVQKYLRWQQKMPRVKPFYAVKSNGSPEVIKILNILGTGFDCASKTEIQTILALGVDPSRIIYANPCKTRGFIRHAYSVGVNKMTFDNEVELHKIKALHPNAELVIRIRVDDSSSVCPLGIKFGCSLKDAAHLLKVAKSLDLNVIGVSFHVGSNCQDSSAFTSAILSSRHVFNIAADIGYNMDLLDIGGGFPGSKGPYVSFEEIAKVVNQALDEYFPPELGVNIIAEPGRYFVASAFTLCANIIAKRDTVAEDGEASCMYYLNDGVYGSFNCLIFDHAEIEAVPLVDSKYRKVVKSSLWGPTCDSIDVIVKSCDMPVLNVGEWIMFENMGAYTICAASTFNGFQQPEMKWILPVHILKYLKSLPNWPSLLEAFGDQVVNLTHHMSSEKDSSLSEICLLPQPVSA